MEQNNQRGGAPERRPQTHGAAGKKRRRQSGRRVAAAILKVLGTLVVMGCLTVGMFAWIFMQYVNNTLAPELHVSLDDFTMAQTSVVYYQDGETGQWRELQQLAGVENRTLVTYEQIPDHMIKALVAIEDQRFWEHHGVDWKRTLGAVVNMFFGMRDTFGGSTITQQTVKNVTGENGVTVKRKITEIFRALELEKNYEKEDILETYLNLVFFGNRAYGVQAAAETYFGKNVEDLTLAESAMIVGLTNNPSRYNPLGEDWQKEAARNRQLTVLSQMLKQGIIDQATHDAAENEELIFVGTPEYEALHAEDPGEAEAAESTEVFSYFVDALFNQLQRDLSEQLGVSTTAAERLLYTGGYKIYATIDPEIQEIAESVYEDQSNLDVQSPKGEQLQSGITILDPYTGEVKAIVGGIGEKTASRIDNYALARQPCGSAFKAVSVYAPAIDNGTITMASIYDDYPVSLNDSGSAGWPVNSPQRYRGLISVRTAVLNSTNTNAVRIVRDLTTASSFEFLTQKLGFDLDSYDIAEAPLSMGGLTYGVTTMEMAAAYASFANNGVYNEPRLYTMVLDADGEMDAEGNVTAGSVVLENPQNSWVAMKSTTAYLMNELLKGVVTSGTGTGARFSGMTIAGKTGTTSNNYDRYFVGYTPYYSAAVWVGYAKSDASITGVSGNPAAALWKKVMEQVHEGLEDRSFITTSDGTHTITTCLDCGLLANDSCTAAGRSQSVRVADGTGPTEECSCHQTIEICSHVVTNEDGTTTTEYHLAGQYCPAETVHSITVTSVPRETLYRRGGSTTYVDPATGETVTVEGVAITAEDDDHMLNTWLRKGQCPYHTEFNWWEPLPPDEEIYYDENGNPVDAEGNPIEVPPQEEDPSGGTEGGQPQEPDEPDEPGGGGLSDFLEGLFNRGSG